MDNFTRGYIAAALWSSNDDNDEPLDSNYSVSDISEGTLEQMEADCAKFQADNDELLDIYYDERSYDPSQGTVQDYAGHDFWLSRNGHGVGFSDRYDVNEETRDALDKAAENFSQVDLYVGDDGEIYS